MKTRTGDNWFVLRRKNGLELLEGAGVHGGKWAIRDPRGLEIFDKHAEAVREFMELTEDAALTNSTPISEIRRRKEVREYEKAQNVPKEQRSKHYGSAKDVVMDPRASVAGVSVTDKSLSDINKMNRATWDASSIEVEDPQGNGRRFTLRVGQTIEGNRGRRGKITRLEEDRNNPERSVVTYESPDGESYWCYAQQVNRVIG